MARRHIMESTFRLNLLNPQHAKINEVIKGLNPKIYKSKNQFLIEACEFYIDHYGEDDIPSKEEKRYEQFVTRDEIEQIKKEIEYSAMTEARKEVISLLGGALAGVKNSQPVMVAILSRQSFVRNSIPISLRHMRKSGSRRKQKHRHRKKQKKCRSFP